MAITGRDYERRLQRIPAYLPRPARLAFTDHSPAVLYTNFRACVREYSAHRRSGLANRSRSDAAHRSFHRDHFQGQNVSLVDDSDTNTASAVEGAVQQNLGTFQAKERDLIVESLPEDVIELGKKLPVDIRKQFVSLMTAWTADSKNLYNPKSRFIDYVVPGVIGLILQLLTVTLMACTIARERE